MATPAPKRVSFAEYIERERITELKNEYFDGEIFAMAGASNAHEQIAGDIFGELRSALKDRRCNYYKSDMKVVCPTGLGTYPDVFALCGDVEFFDDKEDVVTNPQVIIEVLSPSTETYDRGTKFRNYQTLTSLREYVLVAQDQVLVEVYRRDDAEHWRYSLLDSRRDTLHIETFDVSLSLADIFARMPDPPPHSDSTPPRT